MPNLPRLAGADPVEWLKRAFALSPYRVISSPGDVAPVEDADYIAVIPSSMPLVTAEDLSEIVREMEKRAVSALEIGEGRVLTKRAFQGGETPKRRLRTERLLSLGKAENVSRIERELYRRNAYLSARNGAIIEDPDSVRIDYSSVVAAGAKVSAFSVVTGSEIREEAEVGPFSVIENSVLDRGAVVTQSVVRDSVIGKGATVGPFAYVRMESAIGANCRIGDFVEVKRSLIADGAKAAHLTYIGDAEVGLATNVGCGTVFANYDGKKKSSVKVGDRVFIGANTNLIAPVTVGSDAYIAAATTVTEDVPDGSFVIGRSRAEIKKRDGKC